MRMTLTIAVCCGLLAAAPALPALAQDEDELLRRFEQQRATHRGLKFSPTAAEAAAPAPAASARPTVEPSDPDRTETAKAPARARPAAAPSARPAAQPVAYVPMGEDAEINIRIEFDFDSAVLRASELPKLEAICGAIARSDVGQFNIYGHTDASGSEAYNLTLSQLRAEEIRRHLIEECGIAPGRLNAVGLGERHLYDARDPRAPENRRVEFQAVS